MPLLGAAEALRAPAEVSRRLLERDSALRKGCWGGDSRAEVELDAAGGVANGDFARGRVGDCRGGGGGGGGND